MCPGWLRCTLCLCVMRAAWFFFLVPWVALLFVRVDAPKPALAELSFCQLCPQAIKPVTVLTWAPCMQLAELPVEDAPVDTTAEEWFRGRCDAAESKRVLPLLDAFYANDLCSDLLSLGVAEAAWEAKHWTDGEDTLVKGGTMAPLTAALSRGVPVRLGWPVQEIRWRAQGATWSSGSGDAGAGAEAAAEIVGTNGEVRTSLLLRQL